MKKTIAKIMLASLLVIGMSHTGAVTAQGTKTFADTYRSMSQLDPWTRKSVLLQLDKKSQARLWAIHINLTATNYELTDKQRAFVARVVEYLLTHELDDYIASTQNEMFEVFKGNEKTAFEIFVNFGSAFTHNGAYSVGYFTTCSCSLVSDWCSWSSTGTCTHQVPDCEHTTGGCGYLWSYPCDGICQSGKGR